MSRSTLTIRSKIFPAPLSCGEDPLPQYEFHIQADVRKKYQFDESLYSMTGNVIFPNFRAVRIFANKMNEHRDTRNHPERAVKAGHLNAMGLIDEILHYMFGRYEESENPGVLSRALKFLEHYSGRKEIENLLSEFVTTFPPLDVHRQHRSATEYLRSAGGPTPHREVTLEELLLLWFANINPAFAPYKELFDDRGLEQKTEYGPVINALQSYFQGEQAVASTGESILDFLRAPMLASPHSIEGQLTYIRRNWGVMLSKQLTEKMTGADDLIREESKIIVHGGDRPTPVPTYSREQVGTEADSERFTIDLEWMPNVVLLAKNIYVWLDQLSKKYGRSIRTLGEIPDEELDQLQRWNFNGIWLIGIWERSAASQEIKQRMGNPEAVASAYSLFDYEIAGDLGGEQAFDNFSRRAWERGIRAAGDMVPNHVGIYSRWVVEHPEYFISSSYSPFPNYRFTGPNLSRTPGIEIRLEDGYWTRRDAAVVFQRIDRSTGDTRYVYHGNDGTNMPWNDTAQLDFLKPEVREAVIERIFHVAQKFSIIRFDAAMVLAKKHFQRLWYPQPGSGGDIPSRADYAMSKEDFDRNIPNEFWREVVDRINDRKPDTLLLAEAFWLLEGYFVRTLGMHRVYNSAFMHMMMKEENAKYRELISNTLAFNPEILKRYVNFMSNPDERTAIDQFGKEDKYFGVAMMMVTMPGLPMFAHGQIEGFTEKYGMEYMRAYYGELLDATLVARHEREIFPVLAKRFLFSHVTEFELFNVYNEDGSLNENVFCYTNRAGDHKALFCYNNRYERSVGYIGTTVAKVVSNGEVISGRTVGNVLALSTDEHRFYAMREHRTGLEYLRASYEFNNESIPLTLDGYQYVLYLDIREIRDENGDYRRLYASLEGKGTQDISRALTKLRLQPVHDALHKLLHKNSIEQITSYLFAGDSHKKNNGVRLQQIQGLYENVIDAVQSYEKISIDKNESVKGFLHDIDSAKPMSVEFAAHQNLNRSIFQDKKTLYEDVLILFASIVLRQIEKIRVSQKRDLTATDDFMLRDVLQEIAATANHDRKFYIASLIIVLSDYSRAAVGVCESQSLSAFAEFLQNQDVQHCIGVHTYEGVVYFNKEQFEKLIDWMTAGVLTGHSSRKMKVQNITAFARRLKEMSSSSSYRFEAFRQLLYQAHESTTSHV